jgi:hypothetical protein
VLYLTFENIFGYETKAELKLEVNEEKVIERYRLVKRDDVKTKADEGGKA